MGGFNFNSVEIFIDGQPIDGVSSVELENIKSDTEEVNEKVLTIKNSLSGSIQLDPDKCKELLTIIWHDIAKAKLLNVGISEEAIEYILEQSDEWALETNRPIIDYIDAVIYAVNTARMKVMQETIRNEIPLEFNLGATDKNINTEPRKENKKQSRSWEKQYYWSK